MEYDSDIFDAVEAGNLEEVKQYWREEINIDFQDENGLNLIMLASIYNHIEVVKFLLTLNPDLYLRNNEGETVFQIAERLEDKEVFKNLVKYTWKENEKLFIFEYHVKPKFESDFLGAFVDCWVMDNEFNNAKFRSESLIEKESWEIDSIESISEIKRGEIKEDEERYKYYEQVIIDKEVLVFYTYDGLEGEIAPS